ncbi:hypothetical protein BD560DRAFT_424456 [Blakeslea trispora]|nr:hypothetical protein BD560DRAFT_424456 [Blakeslea trispora]
MIKDVVYFWYYAPFCVSRCWNNGDIYDVASIVAVSELFPFSVDVPYLILFYFIVLILTFLTLRVRFIVSSEVEECINFFTVFYCVIFGFYLGLFKVNTREGLRVVIMIHGVVIRGTFTTFRAGHLPERTRTSTSPQIIR